MKDNFYICTAIPYVNDKPHIGHAMDFIYADILARYNRAQGKDVVFSIGTDEHGTKIAEKAAENNLSPQAFADSIVPKWQHFAKIAHISNDRFIRTSQDAHIERIKLIWQKLEKYIYKGNFEGWYCVGCEEYKTDTVVKETDGKCPDHNRAYEKLKEENYFFKLSAFSAQLKESIENNYFEIVPSYRGKEMLNLIEVGLNDVSISRPKDKLDWGVPVPGDDGHVMYVWFEAVCNYITVLGYPEHEDFKEYWPANVQVIGKDITKFHALIWPAILIGLGEPLFKKLYSHGFITSEGKKMSKTIGNVVDPVQVIDTYGVDAFRYFLARHIPSHDDGDYSVERFEAAYNGELANELGNAVSRVASMITKYQQGVIGEVKDELHDPTEYDEAIAAFRFDRALDLVWLRVQDLNKYIEIEQPWSLAKTDTEHLQEVLAYSASSLLEIARLLGPFMPSASQKITEVFTGGVVQPLEAPLFPRLDTKNDK
ncbi:MAG: methionine--tRNA ligase [Patescibacteria group bacterium]